MALKKVLHMNGGDGETSYASNSGLQKAVISKTWAVLDETLKRMFTNNGFPKCLKMVDLGCASGLNTFLVISHIMDTIEELHRLNNVNSLPEEVEVFLNDLPDNDFNNLFKLLPNFYHKNGKARKSECFTYAVSGSFYGRLFPSRSLHFAYSSYSLHWLSQVPQGLGENNKENIYMAMTSPPEVYEAYAKQYQRDFSNFLSLRGEEIIPGGRMVLTFIGRSVVEPSSQDDGAVFTLLGQTLSDMVAEGLVKKDDLYSFNVPMYGPCMQEVETMIIEEGSFNLDEMEVVQVPWDANDDYDKMVFDKYRSGQLVADCVRAFSEPMLACHFGSSIVEGVFSRYAKKIADYLSIERSSYFTIIISLTRK